MSPHWRLAFRYAAWVSGGAVVAAGATLLIWGVAYAGAFLYGTLVGLLSFVSMAATVSLLTKTSNAGLMLLGATSFAARCGFVAVALGVPAYLHLWPLLAMFCGFALVYLAENVVLLPMVPKAIGGRAKKGDEARRAGQQAKRKANT